MTEESLNYSKQQNGNSKWEARFVWTTRTLIALLTFLALTIWNDLRAVGQNVATLAVRGLQV